MPIDMTSILIFAFITAAVLALASVFMPSKDRVAERVRQLSGAEPPKAETDVFGQLWRGAGARLVRLFPANGRLEQWRLRLTHAGYSDPQALAVLLAVRLLLALVPLVAAAVAVLTEALGSTRARRPGRTSCAAGCRTSSTYSSSASKAGCHCSPRGGGWRAS
jgi:hypothetical protein